MEMRQKLVLVAVLVCGLVSAGTVQVFADFEGDAYPMGWTTTGTAFGKGPARGAHPKQMAVSRYLGRGLANSFLGGDGAMGTLTSPTFKIERKIISFLVGGGACVGKLGVELVVDGTVVRSVTGRNLPNTGVGVGEALAPVHWDVSDFLGKTARIRIVDALSCGWGHINVDHICFADEPVMFWRTQARTLKIEGDVLYLPIGNSAARFKLHRSCPGADLPPLDIQLVPAEAADWWAPMDVSALKGRELTFSLPDIPVSETNLLAAIRATAPAPRAKKDDLRRPQFHYSQRFGWNNDPNGMVYRDGEWHFFHQHNPYGIGWGNMHWYHAVSRDLVHWTECGDALVPDSFGTMFSGSGVVDRDNVAGFGANALVFFYTAAGDPFTQCLASSVDGRTLVKYPGNPIVGNRSKGNRDPKVFWHAPSKAWVMVLYGDDGTNHVFWFYRSKDLKTWTPASTLVGDPRGKGIWRYECPGLEELKIEGEQGTAWVLWGAGPHYDVGTFDGFAFKPIEEKLYWVQDRGTTYYAAQTFSNAPDGRCVWVAWLKLPQEKENTYSQSYSLPMDLSLRRTKGGLRLVRRVAKELTALRKGPAVPLAQFNGELVEAHLACTLPADGAIRFDLRGIPLAYDAKAQKLTVDGKTVDWPTEQNRLALQVYLDRTSIEILSEDGLLLIPKAITPDPARRTLSVDVPSGTTDCDFRAYELESVNE